MDSTSTGEGGVGRQFTVSAAQQWAPFSVAMWVVLNPGYQVIPLFEFWDNPQQTGYANYIALFMTNASISTATAGTASFQLLLEEASAVSTSTGLNRPVFNFSMATGTTMRPRVWCVERPARSVSFAHAAPVKPRHPGQPGSDVKGTAVVLLSSPSLCFSQFPQEPHRFQLQPTKREFSDLRQWRERCVLDPHRC